MYYIVIIAHLAGHIHMRNWKKLQTKLHGSEGLLVKWWFIVDAVNHNIII